ncbi:hypothetical protein SETIT_1G261000v2 [Setaria italica]|uniref:Uncharacterized protein n=1 Tax=Setaria italica TaxID=4555 RepID=A0A368PPC9_SETIT|nr:hypothetical protein SETIT_1G261000v2 [Setaria italica]
MQKRNHHKKVGSSKFYFPCCLHSPQIHKSNHPSSSSCDAKNKEKERRTKKEKAGSARQAGLGSIWVGLFRQDHQFVIKPCFSGRVLPSCIPRMICPPEHPGGV